MKFTGSEDQPCGEVFLKDNGNLVVYCTLCNNAYFGYEDYADHVRTNHIFTNTKNDDSKCTFQNDLLTSYENNSFTTLVSEEDLKALENFEFFAPEPTNCKEIEDFVKSSMKIEQKFDCDDELDRIKKVKPKPNPKNVKYKCPQCGLITNSVKSINDHLLRHTGKKPHECKVCSKRFYSTTELKVHMRFHTGERRYLCSDCGHKCFTTSALRTHIKSCRDIRDHDCKICGKKFRTEKDVKEHMTSHSDKREYHCKVCGAGFKLIKALKTHIKIHENKHEYKCELCPATFNQRPGLYSHMKKHKANQTISEARIADFNM